MTTDLYNEDLTQYIRDDQFHITYGRAKAQGSLYELNSC